MNSSAAEGGATSAVKLLLLMITWRKAFTAVVFIIDHPECSILTLQQSNHFFH